MHKITVYVHRGTPLLRLLHEKFLSKK